MSQARKTQKGAEATGPQPVPAPEPITNDVPTEPVDDDPPIVWAVDPDATWWDDVWPFVDETELAGKSASEPAEEQAE